MVEKLFASPQIVIAAIILILLFKKVFNMSKITFRILMIIAFVHLLINIVGKYLM